jgi:hypothetical protein
VEKFLGHFLVIGFLLQGSTFKNRFQSILISDVPPWAEPAIERGFSESNKKSNPRPSQVRTSYKVLNLVIYLN